VSRPSSIAFGVTCLGASIRHWRILECGRDDRCCGEEFLADVKGVLSEDEHDALILYVAYHPDAGDLIPDTGGLRKLRWAAKSKGRRGGSRVIYYFHNLDVPVFLMAIFAKNIQTDLAPRQRKALVRQLNALKTEWKGRRPK